jgi:hypothetical protein
MNPRTTTLDSLNYLLDYLQRAYRDPAFTTSPDRLRILEQIDTHLAAVESLAKILVLDFTGEVRS